MIGKWFRKLKIRLLEWKMAIDYAANDAITAQLKADTEALIAAKAGDVAAVEAAAQAKVNADTAFKTDLDAQVKAAIG